MTARALIGAIVATASMSLAGQAFAQLGLDERNLDTSVPEKDFFNATFDFFPQEEQANETAPSNESAQPPADPPRGEDGDRKRSTPALAMVAMIPALGLLALLVARMR